MKIDITAQDILAYAYGTHYKKYLHQADTYESCYYEVRVKVNLALILECIENALEEVKFETPHKIIAFYDQVMSNAFDKYVDSPYYKDNRRRIAEEWAFDKKRRFNSALMSMNSAISHLKSKKDKAEDINLLVERIINNLPRSATKTLRDDLKYLQEETARFSRNLLNIEVPDEIPDVTN